MNKETTLTTKQEAYSLLRSNGVSVTDASKQLGITRDYGYKTDAKLKKVPKLTESKLVSNAHRTVKKLLNGKPVGKNMKEVKDSTCLRAAEMILDRAEPKVTLSVNATIADPVDLSRFIGVGSSEGDK